MPRTHDIGDRFWHRIKLRKDAPRHHRHETIEYDYPYRRANAHVVRLVGRAGVVVGRWTGKPAENVTSQLFDAIMGHVEAPGVVGEYGVSIEEHRRQSYERAKMEEEYLKATEGVGVTPQDVLGYNGWKVL